MSELTDDEPIPFTFQIPVNETTQDISLSRVVSYECAKNYFKLKKSIYDVSTFNSIYTMIFRKAKEYDGDRNSIFKRNLDGFDIFKKIIYIPQRGPDFFYGMSGEVYHTSSIQHILSEMYPGSFLIIDSQNGALTITPDSWHIYLICNPLNNIACVYCLQDASNYILNSLNDVHMECTIMTR